MTLILCPIGRDVKELTGGITKKIEGKEKSTRRKVKPEE